MDLSFSKADGYVIRTNGTNSTLGEVGMLFFRSEAKAQIKADAYTMETGFLCRVVPAMLSVSENNPTPKENADE